MNCANPKNISLTQSQYPLPIFCQLLHPDSRCMQQLQGRVGYLKGEEERSAVNLRKMIKLYILSVTIWLTIECGRVGRGLAMFGKNADKTAQADSRLLEYLVTVAHESIIFRQYVSFSCISRCSPTWGETVSHMVVEITTFSQGFFPHNCSSLNGMLRGDRNLLLSVIRWRYNTPSRKTFSPHLAADMSNQMKKDVEALTFLLANQKSYSRLLHQCGRYRFQVCR